MNGQVKVSVIIPVYQVENYLERAVDSVLEQTLSDLEIILVDDGSEDASGRICDDYKREYPDRIKVIHKQNDGLGMARNTGVKASCGEYIAFLDSDDTVEPDMYETMYEKAVAGDEDIVMCDVQILYVAENKTSVSVCYPTKEIDISDYIANGNNITYSVNKLYRRRIWEENRYEKMLFEDIALIPAIMTKYPRIGYVQKAFYHYYRRPNTISTSFVGAMVDIKRAFQAFIDNSNPAYRQEVIYCTAKQLYWNMTQSRVLFQADFIDLLKENKKDFLLNTYIEKDKKIKKILDFIDKPVIPERLICVCLSGEIPDAHKEALGANFPNAELVEIRSVSDLPQDLPDAVRTALTQNRLEFVEEYFALRLLCEKGGIVLQRDMCAMLCLKKLRLYPAFFGFADDQSLVSGCYGALPQHYLIQALLATYEAENIYNKAFLPFAERLRDFLMLHFGLKANGRRQMLKKEIPVFLPNVLAYDMQDGENCCKKAESMALEGYEIVSDSVLKMWSDKLLENWNLYKQERNKKPDGGKKTAPRPDLSTTALAEQELERRVREVVDTYEQSTCWKLTKPIRALARLFGK